MIGGEKGIAGSGRDGGRMREMEVEMRASLTTTLERERSSANVDDGGGEKLFIGEGVTLSPSSWPPLVSTHTCTHTCILLYFFHLLFYLVHANIYYDH